jgi:ribosome-associated protein
MIAEKARKINPVNPAQPVASGRAGCGCVTIAGVHSSLSSRRRLLQPIDLARLIVDVAADKKAEDVLLLDVSQQSVFADYFVLCNATSERQLNAISEGILDEARKRLHARPRAVEGTGGSGWVLIDFIDVIVHIFEPEKRRYYDLEGLWHAARVLVRMQ